jgi:hypothetical protein
LLKDFTGQWSHNPLGELTGKYLTLNWQQELPGAQFFHNVRLTTAGVPQDTRTALLRTMGHYILTKMPEEGLAEALEGLAETYNFWISWKQNSKQSSQPVSNFYDATQGSSYERPKFHVTED